jgi:hypothetical protein
MRVTDDEAKRYAAEPGAITGFKIISLAADLLESRAQVAALTLDLDEHKAALEQAREGRVKFRDAALKAARDEERASAQEARTAERGNPSAAADPERARVLGQRILAARSIYDALAALPKKEG